MRTLPCSVTLVLAVVACGGGEAPKPADQPKPTPPPTASAPVGSASASASATPANPPAAAIDAMSTARTFMDGFNRQDANKYASAYTADAAIPIPGLPFIKGSAAILSEHQKILDSFPDTRINAYKLFAKDDVAILEWVLSATQQNDWMGVKATKKSVGARGVSVMWLDADGNIKKEDRYYDVATILGQLGGLKGKFRSVPLAPGQMKQVSATGAASETSNVEVVKKMFGAFESKTEADFLGAQNDGIELDDQTHTQSYLGIIDTKKMFETWSKALDGIKVQVANAWGFGDWVVTETVITGKQVAPFDGMPASGKPLTLHQAGVFQMKDGKVFKGWLYGNALEEQLQAGVYKMPPPSAPKPAGN